MVNSLLANEETGHLTQTKSRVDSEPLRLKHDLHPEEIRENLDRAQGGMGFLFHATSWDTLEFFFENIGPRTPALEEQLWNTKPVVFSPVHLGKQMIGANIGSVVPLELWMGSARGIKRFRETQFFPALELAKQAGLDMVALGASTPYACNYGALARPLESPRITTGHAGTAAMLKAWAMHCCDEFSLDFGHAKIALFGAAGRLGTTVAKYLCYKDAPKELILIDLPDKLNLLKKRAADLAQVEFLARSKVKISVHTFDPNQSLPEFDGAILTSCTSTPYLKTEDLKRAKFWIDDSHPRAASLEAELQSRNDTLYIECFAQGPAGLDLGATFNLASRQDCYTCFAEGYVAWQEKQKTDFVIGSPPVWTVAHTHNLLKKYGFRLGPFVGKNGATIDANPVHQAHQEKFSDA